MKRILVVLLGAILAFGCRGRRDAGALQSPEKILAQMRADSAWVRELDSLVCLALGPKARCIDPVWHLFSVGEERWFHNQDWGGVLELPDGFTPEDDTWQAELSFHGTAATSADSLMRLSFYAGFGAFSADEYEENARQCLGEAGFRVLEVSHSNVDFGDGIPYLAITIQARSDENVNYYGRSIPSGPDCVEWSAAIQYDGSVAQKASAIIPMIDRYPFSAEGRFTRGEAVK